MPKAKGVNRKKFNSLSYDKQVKEIKAMAKRANVRASLLEKNNVINDVYKQAEYFNTNKGRDKNRFYEGTKYKTHNEVKETFNALYNFLNDKLSTLGGLKTEVEKKVDNLIQKGNFDYNALQEMTTKEKIYASKKLAGVANKKLKELEKAGIDTFAYANAGQYNEATGRKKNTFYKGGKFKDEKDLEIHIQNISHFLKAKTSTPRGYVEVIKNRLDKFREKGLKIEGKDEQKFLDFLSSKQFEALKGYADSNQVLETFVDARNTGEDVSKIQQAYEDFMNNDMTFDEVQEKLKVAKWQQGGLLH